jgi:hypothetical protein
MRKEEDHHDRAMGCSNSRFCQNSEKGLSDHGPPYLYGGSKLEREGIYTIDALNPLWGLHKSRQDQLRYKLILRDLAEMFLEQEVTFIYEAVRD